MDMGFLHDGRPGRKLEAVWVGAQFIVPLLNTDPTRGAMNYTQTLLTLLGHPTIASKESIVRRYDYEVQGATILKPLVGRSGNGPGDAAVLQPILEEQTGPGTVLSHGINPLYGKIAPYHMAINSLY